MSVRKVVQPHPRGRGWNFSQHKARGYLGGDDFEVARNGSVRSPVAGVATSVGGGVVVIRPSAGGQLIYVRELGTVSVSTQGTYVPALGRIGTAGKKWPHYDTTDVFGRRASIMPRVAAYTAYVKKLEAKKEAARQAAAIKASVRRVATYLNDHTDGGNTVTAKTGVRSLTYWRLMQKWGIANGLYAGTVTGIPTTATKAVEQELVNRLKNG